MQDLIKYGLPHDVWFHVDNLSSAHVYLRLPSGATVDDIPPETLEDCAQLVKANSIQGSKQTCVDIVYTPWPNLRKTAAMEVGQVRWPPPPPSPPPAGPACYMLQSTDVGAPILYTRCKTFIYVHVCL